jgi:hypothetical protein
MSFFIKTFLLKTTASNFFLQSCESSCKHTLNRAKDHWGIEERDIDAYRRCLRDCVEEHKPIPDSGNRIRSECNGNRGGGPAFERT